jgi:hypothetical protein
VLLVLEPLAFVRTSPLASHAKLRKKVDTRRQCSHLTSWLPWRRRSACQRRVAYRFATCLRLHTDQGISGWTPRQSERTRTSVSRDTDVDSVAVPLASHEKAFVHVTILVRASMLAVLGSHFLVCREAGFHVSWRNTEPQSPLGAYALTNNTRSRNSSGQGHSVRTERAPRRPLTLWSLLKRRSEDVGV